jgi:Flp pilus assembly pilin Flp
MKHLFKKLSRDNRGVAVVELAFVAPVLAVMVVGVIDMSNSFSRKLKLEQAAQRSLEMVMHTTGDTTAESAIESEVMDEAGVDADQVEVVRLLECDGVSVADSTINCDPGEIEARYFRVTIEDTYEPMFPLTFAGVNDDGVYEIRAVAGMRIK